MKFITYLAIFSLTLSGISCSPKTNINALIVTGQNNHNWEGSSIVLKDILQKSGLFTVTTNISPKKGEDMSKFIIDFSPYDVVVLDYTGDAWPVETRENFVNYLQNGGGVVVYHAANNAFPDWPEYNEIIGLGGWGRRNEKSGPYIYIKNGEVVRDDSPGRGGSHGSQHEFVVQTYKPNHPIMNGLPEKWLHAKDELYSELRGPAKNLEVLAFAHADNIYKGTGRNEPVLMTIRYGKGRIFHTALGHAGGGKYYPAMECAGFITTFLRGTEWAATGKVKQKVPASFPTETQVLQWEFYEDVESSLEPVIKRMREYEIGKSNDSFITFKMLISENIYDQEKMESYHQIIRDLLKSGKTSLECKKILLKDFSWISNDSYLDVYEKLKQNRELADEVQYALDLNLANF